MSGETLRIIPRPVLPGTPAGNEIWAITSYFNPARYRRRWANFREFRRRLGIPLLAVELGFDGQFELSEGDADLLVQISGGDVMWQKERLLNIALDCLPPSCRHVAWIDADIVFVRDDWPERALLALQDAPLVQLFDELWLLPAQPAAGGAIDAAAEVRLPALGKAMRSGLTARECFAVRRSGSAHAYSASPAWAMRRETLSAFGFYDACIVGGGDTALICAMLGLPEVVPVHHQMNERRRDHYLDWAAPVAAQLGGDFAMLDGAALHLWHGHIDDRHYADRHRVFAGFDFDPARDIAAVGNGPWRWNTDRPEMHAYVAAYFGSRHEDGRQVPDPGPRS